MKVDRILIDPPAAELDRTFAEAVKAANGRYRKDLVAWPFADLPDFRRRLASDAEGMSAWSGGAESKELGGRSQVVALWWSDRLGRRHVRVLGGAGRDLHRSVGLRHDSHSELQLPGPAPLEWVYPWQTARVDQGGGARLLALCDCGTVGTPEDLGWMGDCCGPCHDRREEGAPTPLSFRHPEANACVTLLFSPDGQALAGSQGVAVWVRDLTSGALRTLPLDKKGRWRGLGYSADGRRLVILGEDRVGTWDTRREDIREWPLLWHTAFALSPDATTLAVVTAGEQVEVRSTGDGAVRRTLPPPSEDYITELEFSPDGTRLAVGLSNCQVDLWDVATGKQLHEIYQKASQPVKAMTISPDGGLLAAIPYAECRVCLADLSLGKALPQLPGVSSYTGEQCCVCFAPSGRVLLVGSFLKRLSLWDLGGGRRKLELQWGLSNPSCAAWSADGKWLATGDESGHVRIWPGPALLELLGEVEQTGAGRGAPEE